MSSSETGTSRPTAGDGSTAEPRRRRRVRGFFAELPVLVVVAFVLALLLKTFLVQAFYIPSASMEPTLAVGDRVLVNKLVYDVRDPRRGEVVVFETDGEQPLSPQGNALQRLLAGISSGLGFSAGPEKDFIKRIIGLPGETVSMRDGVVYIDGEPLPEASARDGGYLAERDLNDFAPHTVPEGEYFVMGDNRLNSSDSRFSLGTIPRERIVGRAFVIIWPLARLGLLRPGDYGAELAAPPLALAA